MKEEVKCFSKNLTNEIILDARGTCNHPESSSESVILSRDKAKYDLVIRDVIPSSLLSSGCDNIKRFLRRR